MSGPRDPKDTSYADKDTDGGTHHTWYDGDRRPKSIGDQSLAGWPNGVLFVGHKRNLLADYSRHALLPEDRFADFVPPTPTIPDSIGHHEEWIEACKTGKPTTCNFDYSGPLTEAVLLGNVAFRTGSKLHWNAKRLRATNAPEAHRFIRAEARKGWRL